MSKLAIKIENQSQFDVIINHFDGKGFTYNYNWPTDKRDYDPKYQYLGYHDKYINFDGTKSGYEYLSFDTFCKFMGIDIPKKEITIERGKLTVSIKSDSIIIKEKSYVDLHILPELLTEIYTSYQSLL